ncbi:MAG TPA: serine/threonine protein kinase [Anaerolineae bacterium]|nr:serine/threonine protein kinase [Anaerolineae bacterium]
MAVSLQEGVQIGPYRIVKIFPHHRGGFARVAIGVREDDTDHQTLVALKIARTDGKPGDDTYLRALSNEVETLRRLKHPGIVSIYPIKVDDRRFSFMARATALAGQPWYFVMEYLAGGSVEDLIEQYGAMNPVLAAEIAQQVCMALDYMHARGYAHLDVKPNNILFRRPLMPDERPEAVLIDFGSAQKSERRAEVEAGALVYLPPERVRVMIGDKPPESVTDKAAADIYSVGVTLYRMLTGQLPFSGRRNKVTTAILNDNPTRPYQYNPGLRQFRELDELVMAMLDKRPERRPTAQEVSVRLDQIVPPPRFGTSQEIAALETPVNKQPAGRLWHVATFALAAVVIVESGLLFMNRPLTFLPGSTLQAQATPVVITQPPPTPKPILTPAPTQEKANTPQHTPTPTPASDAGGVTIIKDTPSP